MYQPGTILTPGTSVQGQLLSYEYQASDSQPAWTSQWILTGTLTQCGIPAAANDAHGGVHLFVAGQVHGCTSPHFAPWPLSPIHLHASAADGPWELTRLPDKVHDRTYVVSGIPSVVRNGESLLVYFNGGQLLEYICSPDQWWQVTTVPTPDMVVDANPVAAVADGRVFVFSIPGAESLLMSFRNLADQDWESLNLGAYLLAKLEAFDGDPALVFFNNKLHVLVNVTSSGSSPELLDFAVDPSSLRVDILHVSKHAAKPGDQGSFTPAGTPCAIAGETGLHVFARSNQGELVCLHSADGEAWIQTVVTGNGLRIAGEPAAFQTADGPVSLRSG